MKNYLLLPLLLTLAFLFVSCGEENVSTSVQGNSNVPLKINIVAPGQEQSDRTDFATAQIEDFIEFVETIRVVVQGDFPTIIQSFSRSEDVVVFVPPGQNITFIVSLLNSEGQAICSGQTNTDVIPGVANEITVSCEVNEEDCRNNQDDNGNGLTDCEEDSCAGSECDASGSNICIDNVCTPVPQQENDCNDEVDNDLDGATDCNDSDCSMDESCIETVCDDGVDNDSDGDTDCDDLDCSEDTACDEVCNNMEDDDNDGDTDCTDDECDNQNCDAEDEDFVCVEGICEDTGGETVCDNNMDDDGDGLTDCDDLDDCEGRVCFDGDEGSACVIEQTDGGPVGECREVICDDVFVGDGTFPIDNDGDGSANCEDFDCDGENCGTGTGAECDFFSGEVGDCIETICFDRDFPVEGPGTPIDNDLDGSANCEDYSDCVERPCGTGQAGAGAICEDIGDFEAECAETSCGNSEDDDDDGLTDCDDPDCAESTECGGLDCSIDCDGNNPECLGMSCGNGLECQPNDGPLDCVEAICDDAIDNDNNQQTDCEDFFCTDDPACENSTVECGDDADNDLDGATDCEDEGCFEVLAGPEGQVCESFESICDDEFDNDSNGSTDCEQFSCDQDPCGTGSGAECSYNSGVDSECIETACGDGIDNDDDGVFDCGDSDCPLCPQGTLCNTENGMCITIPQPPP